MSSSVSDLEYAAKKKLTRRDRSLAGIHAVTPWAPLEAEIEPFYPKGEREGGLRISLSRMLQMYVASSASACPTEEWKTRCTTVRPSAAL